MLANFPNSRIFFLSASIYVKLKKPNAAIHDANAALEVVYLLLFALMAQE